MLKGFVCPKCRLLVSAEEDLVGRRTTCPSCDSVLKIPSSYDKVEILDVGMTVKAKSKKGSGIKKVYEEDWQRDISLELLSERSKGLPWNMLVPAGIIGLVLFAMMLQMLRKTDFKAPQPNEQTLNALARSVKRDGDKSELNEVKIENFLTKLYESKTTEDLLPLLREVPELKEKLASFYPTGDIKWSQFVKLKNWEWLNELEDVVLFQAELENGEVKLGALRVDETGKLGLDWESYVVYGDVRWEELAKKQPKVGTVIRAVRKKVEYYNYGFDSATWQSFELTYPESDMIYFGYVRRGSELVSQLLPLLSSSGEARFTLKVRYPENVKSNKILIIDEVIEAEWYVNYTK